MEADTLDEGCLPLDVNEDGCQLFYILRLNYAENQRKVAYLVQSQCGNSAAHPLRNS